MSVAENIDALLVKFDITQGHLASIAGVTPGAVSGWRHGSKPREDALRKICAYFNLSEDDLLSSSYGLAAKEHGIIPAVPGARRVQGMAMGKAPRVGRAHAGDPTEPEVFEEDQLVSIPQRLLDQDPGSFVVSSEGDCMNRVFAEGSDLVVSPGKQPQDKSIVLVSIDGGDYVVRRMRRTASTLILSPESFNPEHKDIIITDDSDHVVELKGVVTWFQSAGEME